MSVNNPVAGFSPKDIIRKFHWLIINGFSIEESAKIIKSQTNVQSVIKYVNNYLKNKRS